MIHTHSFRQSVHTWLGGGPIHQEGLYTISEMDKMETLCRILRTDTELTIQNNYSVERHGSALKDSLEYIVRYNPDNEIKEKSIETVFRRATRTSAQGLISKVILESGETFFIGTGAILDKNGIPMVLVKHSTLISHPLPWSSIRVSRPFSGTNYCLEQVSGLIIDINVFNGEDTALKKFIVRKLLPYCITELPVTVEIESMTRLVYKPKITGKPLTHQEIARAVIDEIDRCYPKS